MQLPKIEDPSLPLKIHQRQETASATTVYIKYDSVTVSCLLKQLPDLSLNLRLRESHDVSTDEALSNRQCEDERKFWR